MNTSTILVLVTLATIAIAPSALAQETDEVGAETDDKGVWAQTRDLWDRSREATIDVWEDTRDAARNAWAEIEGGRASKYMDDFDRVWRDVLPKLDEALTLEERHDQLPKRAVIGADKRSNREAIDALLDDAVAILSRSSVQNYRDRIDRLQSDIEEAKEDIGTYRQRRVAAPDKAWVKRTVEDYERKIEQRQEDIARYEEELASVRQTFGEELEEMGLVLDQGQVDILLSTVVGDNLIDLGVVFDNVKAITVQLEGLVVESGEDLERARRYYGMYVVLLRSLNQMHLQIEEAIAGQYIPQIDSIIERSHSLSEVTRELMKQSPDKRELLEANLDAQTLTIEAAGVYREYLLEQSQQVNRARRDLENDIEAAWNTYETVRVSGELVALVRSSRRLLDGLLDRQVPTLRPFENLEMKQEFEKLTQQLRSDV